MINILTGVSPTQGYRLAPVSPGLSVVMLYHQNMAQKLPQEAVLSPRGIGYIEPKWCLSMRWNGIHIISRNYIWCVSLPERQDPGDHSKEIQVWIQIPGRGLQETADTDVTLDFDEAEGLSPTMIQWHVIQSWHEGRWRIIQGCWIRTWSFSGETVFQNLWSCGYPDLEHFRKKNNLLVR